MARHETSGIISYGDVYQVEDIEDKRRECVKTEQRDELQAQMEIGDEDAEV